MKFGVVLQSTDFKAYGDIAHEAEQTGWDAIFIADAISVGFPGQRTFPWFDPWVVLAVMAERTERIKLGTLVAAPTRRRPWKLAREVCTLDHLSNGRIILGVGLGAAAPDHGGDGGFFNVGEPTDLKTRAELLDESLEIIDGLWQGEPFSFTGKHFKIDRLELRPKPVQQPRVPIWVVGVWPKDKSMLRALKYDGVIVQKYKATPESVASADDIRGVNEYAKQHRQSAPPFEIISSGATPGNDKPKATAIVGEYADAGATWWLEGEWDEKKLLARLRQGPPTL